ncbi:MAG: hypothetical protein WA102_06820 [Candidatus Methanoperedens sp.]
MNPREDKEINKNHENAERGACADMLTEATSFLLFPTHASKTTLAVLWSYRGWRRALSSGRGFK